MTSNRFAKTILFSAVALIIGVIESLIPPIFPFLPYVRIGFANIVIVYTLLSLGAKDAYTVAIIKALFTGLIVGNPIMIAYSLPSSLISLTCIIMLLKLNKNSLCAISATGAVIHNLAQLAVASIMANTLLVLSYAPYFVLIGGISGFAIGAIVLLLVKRLPYL